MSNGPSRPTGKFINAAQARAVSDLAREHKEQSAELTETHFNEMLTLQHNIGWPQSTVAGVTLGRVCANHTLADVQPGGRVRLGDQAERARFEDWGRAEGLPLARGKLGGYAFEITAKAWRAWQYLSAQPSPGGQGHDDVLADIARKVVELIGSARPHHRKAVENALYQVLPALRDSLAARQPVVSNQPSGNPGELDVDGTRQPVGEPVGHIYQGSSRIPQAFLSKELPVGTLLYAAPPAQAVDLGQFRDAVTQWKLAAERVIRCKGHAMAQDKVKVRDEAVRLLALIDSQAVGNG